MKMTDAVDGTNINISEDKVSDAYLHNLEAMPWFVCDQECYNRNSVLRELFTLGFEVGFQILVIHTIGTSGEEIVVFVVTCKFYS